ncbi:hypothetical protein KUW00_19690 [Halomonas sp. DP5N14-9]|uniref:hypothetical protein n=1 Tax=Halomonas sp. DP5N14-9 TaxID=2859075 RepID=UPI001C99B527|nr:hypothetical protein [Halomonas sp. DP5N14-9]MBY5943102.1 hypothetical protein [Halomonas sp. DP5N14-9]
MSDYKYPHADIVGKEVVIMVEKFKSTKSRFDGVVVSPGYQSDKVFVHVYFLGSEVTFDRALIKTEDDLKDNSEVARGYRRAEKAWKERDLAEREYKKATRSVEDAEKNLLRVLAATYGESGR